MKYTIITGMSKSYYDSIGKYMLESWIEYWPKDFQITVYTEDDLNFIDDSRINVVNLDTLGEEYLKFQAEDLSHLLSKTQVYSKKAFPIIKHLSSNTGRLIWVDADVITKDTITESWLDNLLPTNNFSCHLGVPQAEYYSVETGFFIIDLSHPFKEKFLEKYKNIYYNRDFSNMKKSFDGDTFGRVITELSKSEDFLYKELNPNLNKASPFNKVFKGIMSHYKARRKEVLREEFIK